MASFDLCLRRVTAEMAETVVVADRVTSELPDPVALAAFRVDRVAPEDHRSDRPRGCRWEARARSVTECEASGRCPSFPRQLTEDTTDCGG